MGRTIKLDFDIGDMVRVIKTDSKNKGREGTIWRIIITSGLKVYYDLGIYMEDINGCMSYSAKYLELVCKARC